MKRCDGQSLMKEMGRVELGLMMQRGGNSNWRRRIMLQIRIDYFRA